MGSQTKSGATTGAMTGMATGAMLAAGPLGWGALAIGGVLGALGGGFIGSETDRRYGRIRSMISERIRKLGGKKEDIDAWFEKLVGSAEQEQGVESAGLYNKFQDDSNQILTASEYQAGSTGMAYSGTATKDRENRINTLEDWWDTTKGMSDIKWQNKYLELTEAKKEAHEDVDDLIDSLNIRYEEFT